MKKILCLLFGMCVVTGLHAQKLTEQQLNQVNGVVYDSLSKENFIKMNRNTSGGRLTSCELEYQYSYRDFKSLRGQTVMVVGNFSVMYFAGKNNIVFGFKIVPNVSDVNTQSWNYQFPPYADVFISNQGIEKYKVREFSCDPKGRCFAYGDANLDLMKLVLTPKPFDAEVKFSLTKGGMDNNFNFSSLLPKDKSEIERRKFNGCMGEILELVANDLEKVK